MTLHILLRSKDKALCGEDFVGKPLFDPKRGVSAVRIRPNESYRNSGLGNLCQKCAAKRYARQLAKSRAYERLLKSMAAAKGTE